MRKATVKRVSKETSISATLLIAVVPSILEPTAAQITTSTTASKSVAGKGNASGAGS